jgi:hypothetical protein
VDKRRAKIKLMKGIFLLVLGAVFCLPEMPWQTPNLLGENPLEGGAKLSIAQR